MAIGTAERTAGYVFCAFIVVCVVICVLLSYFLLSSVSPLSIDAQMDGKVQSNFLYL